MKKKKFDKIAKELNLTAMQTTINALILLKERAREAGETIEAMIEFFEAVKKVKDKET